MTRTAADQMNDVNGSDLHDSNLNIADEALSLGSPTGNAGDFASIISMSGSQLTLTGLTGMSLDSVGNFLQLSNAANISNNGLFEINSYISATSVSILNGSGSAPDANNGSIIWIERNPYSLQDDLNYARSDRKDIKGVDYYQTPSPYTKPTGTTISVPINLQNISGKTTDARGFFTNHILYNILTSAGTSILTVNSTNNLKHCDTVDLTGVPAYDTGPYAGDFGACFVQVNDGYNDAIWNVQSGMHKGEKVYGLTYSGASTSPNSVEIHFFSYPNGLDPLTNSSAYIWEQTKNLTLLYGYFQRLDQLPDDAFRRVPIVGLLESDSTTGGGGTTGITAQDHETLRQLIHLADGSGGPFEGFASGAYREILPLANPFPTSVTWYNDSTKAKKIVEKDITYNSNKTCNTLSWTAYDIDGSTPIGIVQDTISYSGVFETNRLRSISSTPASNDILTPATHEILRQLIHLADGVGGPFEGFTSGAYRETLPTADPFPTSVIWYNNSFKTQKIVEKIISYNSNKTVSSISWSVYAIDGSTILATVSDSLIYSGVFEIDRTRSIS